ncbi:MAG: hypothetical protein QOG96_1719 [Pseudonocardiales bacterium]|nr:hypothetical protein [Pseudonocardiales bacterium]
MSRRGSGRVLLVLVALLGLLLPAVAACGAGPGSGSTVGAAVGPVPAPELQRFYAQELVWSRCAPFDCTYLRVPLDYGQPAGRTARLAVLRQRASQPDRRIGSLVINPGGPGESGTDAATGLAKRVRNTPLGERFDLVGFDPRGVGKSEPAIECFTATEQDADRADAQLDNSPAGVARQEGKAKDYDAKCAQRSGADLLANVGTRDAARDMDVLRSALGDQKLTYLGYSYGTRLGYTYAEQFPNNVRALVLDGALDPDQTQIDRSVAQSAGFQRAFDAFAAWCAPKRPCPIGNDPAAANQVFRDLVLPTITAPVPLSDGRILSYNDAMTGTISALYSARRWEQLRHGLVELAGGHGDVLMELADSYQGRGPDGSYDRSTDAFTAIRCVDDKPITDPVVLAESDRRSRAAAPFRDDGRGVDPARDVCAFWPVPHTGEPHQPKVAGLPQTVVISVTGDPATPYQAGVNLARSLNARLISVQGSQHTAALHGNRCVDDLVTSYLTDLAVPAEGAHCTIAPS